MRKFLTDLKDSLIASIGSAVLYLITGVLMICMIPVIIGAYALEGYDFIRAKLSKQGK